MRFRPAEADGDRKADESGGDSARLMLREIWPAGHLPESDEALRDAVAELIDAGVIDPETGALRAGELHAEDLDPEVIAALQWLGQLMAGAQESRDGAQERSDRGRSEASRGETAGAGRAVFLHLSNTGEGRVERGAPQVERDESTQGREAAGAERSAHGGDQRPEDADRSDRDTQIRMAFMAGRASGSETADEARHSAAGESAARRQHASQASNDRAVSAQVDQHATSQSARGVAPIWMSAAVADPPAEARAAQVEQWIALMNRSAGDGGRATTLTTIGGGQSTVASGGMAGSIAGESGGSNAPTSSSALLEASSRFTGQVMRGMTAVMNQQGGSMTMRLDPPELGQLRIQMTVSRGVVTASFQASTAQAAQLIEQNMSTLRASLEQHGMTVERLTVQQPPAAAHANDARDDGGQHRQQHDGSGHRGGSGEEDGHRDGERGPQHRQFDETFQHTVDHSDDDREQEEAHS